MLNACGYGFSRWWQSLLSWKKLPATNDNYMRLSCSSPLLRRGQQISTWPRNLSGVHAVSIVFTIKKVRWWHTFISFDETYTFISFDKIYTFISFDNWANRHWSAGEVHFAVAIQKARRPRSIDGRSASVAITKTQKLKLAVMILRLFCKIKLMALWLVTTLGFKISFSVLLIYQLAICV